MMLTHLHVEAFCPRRPPGVTFGGFIIAAVGPAQPVSSTTQECVSSKKGRGHVPVMQ